MKTGRTLRAGGILALGIVVGALGASARGPGARDRGPKEPARQFSTNEEFINGLYAGLDLSSTTAVFRYVFHQLRSEVTVYPTENYYYFEFPARGKMVGGSLNLAPGDRDRGILGFGYYTKVPDKSRAKFYFARGGGADLTEKDGVRVTRLAEDRYAVRFEGKTVVFVLNPARAAPPDAARLLPGERFVGTTFDESGLRFHLLFHERTRRLFWILDEDGFVPESFSRDRDLVMGDRTEYVFWDDSLRARKVLIGVAGLNVVQNNWYDGPFDQLPDNEVAGGRLDLKPFLLAHYGGDSTGVGGRVTAADIDSFGNYSRESRMAVAPYTVYFSARDLAFADSCRGLGLSPEEHCRCLTEQRYEVPANFYRLRVPRAYY